MKKIALVLVIIAMIVVMCSCNPQESNLDKEICQLALQDLSYDSNYKTSLEFVKSESQSWLEYDVYTYILKVTKDDKTTEFYIVDVQRNENEIHYVDVISKI
mgnify:CR=1 FL=1